MQTIKANPLQTEHADINGCLVNCESQVERAGGSVILGWSMDEYVLFQELRHHAIWQDDRGDYWEITPVLTHVEGDMVWSEIRETDFLIDNNATFPGEKPFRTSRPSRYIPKYNHKFLARSLEALAASNEAYYRHEWCKGDESTDTATYWGNRALQALKISGRMKFNYAPRIEYKQF